MEHSRTPWITFKQDRKIRIMDADKLCVTGEDEIIMRHDAKFIVEACNNYERLQEENAAWETNYQNLLAQYEEISAIAYSKSEEVERYKRAIEELKARYEV